jgi:hypothetical protein
MKHSVILIAVVTQALTSCAKKKSDPAPTAESQRTDQLALPVDPADALKSVSTAMTSVSDIKSEKGNTMNPAALAIPLTDASTYCANTGAPIDGKVTGGTGKYAALVAYCNFARHPDGPDTVLGAIDRVQGVLCALGDLTYDGTERTIKMKFTTDCFTQTFVDMANQELGANVEVDAVVTAKEPVDATFGSTDYAKSITFNIASVGFSYDIIYKQNGAVLSAAIREGTGIDSDGTYFAINLDRGATPDSEGTVLVDGRFSNKTEQSGGSPSVRHVRAFAKGKYDLTTSSMTTASNIEFMTADYSQANSSGYFRSIKGNPTDGIYAIDSTSSGGSALTDYTAWATTGTQMQCYGDGACTGNAGISFKSADDLKFITSVYINSAASVYKSADYMFKNAGILTFTSVNPAE